MAVREEQTQVSVEPLIPEDSFAVRLVVLRKHLGLTQGQAADLCDLDDGSWSNWENGTKPQGMDRIVGKISEALHVDRDWLMWGGGLRTGSFSPLLACLPEVTGQGSLLDDDGNPLDFSFRPTLTSV